MTSTTMQSSRTHRSPRRDAAGLVDRLVVSVLLLAIAAASAIAFLVSASLIDAGNVIADASMRQVAFGFIESASAGTRWVISGVALAVGVGASAVFLRRLASPEPTAAAHILEMSDQGLIVVDNRSVCSVAETAVLRIRGILDAEVTVIGRGSSPVRLKMTVWLIAGSDLKRVGGEASEAARSAVERFVGLDVSDVSVALEVVRPDMLDGELGE